MPLPRLRAAALWQNYASGRMRGAGDVSPALGDRAVRYELVLRERLRLAGRRGWRKTLPLAHLARQKRGITKKRQRRAVGVSADNLTLA